MNYTAGKESKLKSRRPGRPIPTAITVALALAWLMLSAPAVRAVSLSYDFSISSNYPLLVNPQSSSAQSMVSQMSSGVVKTANNNPVIMITNTSPVADISDVKLTLTDPDSVFNALKLLQNPLGATPAAPFTNSVWGGSTTTVDIALPTPLAPNQSLAFAVNLGPQGGFPNPSWAPGYQNILFNQPGDMNAQVAVNYFDPATPANTQTLNSVLPNLTAMDPMVTVMSSCCSTPSTSVFQTSFGTMPPVPEPSSILLVALAALPAGIWARRKRQAASSVKRLGQPSRFALSRAAT